MMLGVKPAIASGGIIASAVTILAGVAQIAGYVLTPDDQAAMAALISQGFILVTGLITLITGAVSLWKRWTATKQISGIITVPGRSP